MVNRIDFKHRVPCVAACFITAFQLIPNDTFGGRRRGRGRRDSTRAKNWKQCTENTYTSSFVYRKKMSFSGKNNRDKCVELLRNYCALPLVLREKMIFLYFLFFLKLDIFYLKVIKCLSFYRFRGIFSFELFVIFYFWIKMMLRLIQLTCN